MFNKLKDHNNYKKDFLQVLETIDKSKRPYQIFFDWLIMASAALYSWMKDEAVEKEYQNIAKQYSKKQLLKFSELLATTVNALTNEPSDFLGAILMELKAENKRKGQYFTPQDVSNLISEITIDNIEDYEKIITIQDPCCGSGRMLISVANTLKNKNFNYQKNAYFVAQDIDIECCYMAFIQLSFLGMPSCVICCNSLWPDTMTWQRKTLFYFINNIEKRLYEQDKKDVLLEKKNINFMSKEVEDFLQKNIV
jgi:type I restriction-modification system DNA methylase subunit